MDTNQEIYIADIGPDTVDADVEPAVIRKRRVVELYGLNEISRHADTVQATNSLGFPVTIGTQASPASPESQASSVGIFVSWEDITDSVDEFVTERTFEMINSEIARAIETSRDARRHLEDVYRVYTRATANLELIQKGVAANLELIREVGSAWRGVKTLDTTGSKNLEALRTTTKGLMSVSADAVDLADAVSESIAKVPVDTVQVELLKIWVSSTKNFIKGISTESLTPARYGLSPSTPLDSTARIEWYERNKSVLTDVDELVAGIV